jgi:hypothetical protein
LRLKAPSVPTTNAARSKLAARVASGTSIHAFIGNDPAWRSAANASSRKTVGAVVATCADTGNDPGWLRFATAPKLKRRFGITHASKCQPRAMTASRSNSLRGVSLTIARSANSRRKASAASENDPVFVMGVGPPVAGLQTNRLSKSMSSAAGA